MGTILKTGTLVDSVQRVNMLFDFIAPLAKDVEGVEAPEDDEVGHAESILGNAVSDFFNSRFWVCVSSLRYGHVLLSDVTCIVWCVAV